jgi:hypothetical protein
MSKEWASKVDAGIIQFVSQRVQTTLESHQQTLIFLKMADGGLGFGSAELRNEAAWIGAWEGGLQAVAVATGMGSFAEFCDRWPAWAKAVTKADGQLGRLQGKAVDPTRWTNAFQEPLVKKQGEHGKKVAITQTKKHRALLNRDNLGRVEQQSGPGAGAYLVPGEGNPRLADPHFRVATRRRLLCAELVTEGSNTCCHRNVTTTCAIRIPKDHGKHAISCQIGGGVVQRHAALRDTVAKWVEELGYQPKREQAMPKWNKETERAILDVVYIDNSGREIAIDTAVVDGAEGGTRAPARFALQRMEKKKHVRYAGAGLYPFVIDCRGRWGREALAWATIACSQLPQEEKAKMMRRLRVMVSVTVQQATAEQVLSASRLAEGVRRGAGRAPHT